MTDLDEEWLSFASSTINEIQNILKSLLISILIETNEIEKKNS